MNNLQKGDNTNDVIEILIKRTIRCVGRFPLPSNALLDPKGADDARHLSTARTRKADRRGMRESSCALFGESRNRGDCAVAGRHPEVGEVRAMPITYPNQKTVVIHREPAKSDFLGIKNENWQAAARDLRPHALLLYLYFAANANNYSFALSPAAVQEAVGMPRSTFSDQLRVLISKGYLVLSHGNTYDFYEVPQTRGASSVKNTCLGQGFENNCPALEKDMAAVVSIYPTEDKEINNRENGINN